MGRTEARHLCDKVHTRQASDHVQEGEHYPHEEIHEKTNATGASSSIHVAPQYNFTLTKCLPNLRLSSGISFDIKLILYDLGLLFIELTV